MLSGSVNRSGDQGHTAHSMDGDQRRPAGLRGPRRRLHRVGNVVELEVEENALPLASNCLDDRWTTRSEKLAPDLVERAGVTEPPHQRQRLLLVRHIKRDDRDWSHDGHSRVPVSDATEAMPRTSHQEARSRRSLPGSRGSRMTAVPMANAVAPAIRYCRASLAVAMPPTPMIGAFVARYTFDVASTPIGSNAPPLTPPLPKPSSGFRVSRSTSSPGIVFTSVRPFA